MITFGTSVCVERPIEDVFAFVSDPLQFPRWNSAVETVRPASGDAGEPGSRYSMVRDLPMGRVENELEVLTRAYPSEFLIRTTSGPTPFTYRYRFRSESGITVVRLDARVELPGVPAVLSPFAARSVTRGVDANFADLQRTLERAVSTSA